MDLQVSARLGARQKTRNQKACTNCRQVKLRCDSVHTFPTACTRCQKNTLQCRFDPGFKRFNTRCRSQRVTNQAHDTHTYLREHDPAASLEKSSGVNSTLTDSHQPEAPSTEDLSYEPEDVLFSQLHRFLLAPQLGATALEHKQVKCLFGYFRKHYYRHCPILDTGIFVARLYETSPILFWTITIIAMRWHPSLHSLYERLKDPYLTLLGKILVEPIHSIETVQALAFLCFWPLPVSRQLDDPSWNYCGIMINAAIRLELNKSSDISKEAASSEQSTCVRRKTWMACVQALCSTAWSVGVSVSLDVLSNIITPVMKSTLLEAEFTVKAQILQKSARASLTISTLHEEMDTSDFVHSLCKELDSIRDLNQEIWTLEMEVMVLGSQLGLFLLQLERGQRLQTISKATGHLDVESSRTRCLHLAYLTATHLINSFSQTLELPPGQSDSMNSDPPQRHLPKHHFRLLLCATTFLLRAKSLPAQDLGYGQLAHSQIDNHVRIVYEILAAWSREPLDEAGRAMRLIRVVTRHEKEMGLQLRGSRDGAPPGLAVVDELIATAKAIRKREAESAEDVTAGIEGVLEDNLPTLDTEFGSVGGWEDMFFDWSLPCDLELSDCAQ